MSTSIEKQLLKTKKAAHRARYGVPFPKKKCMYNHAEDCLRIALPEDMSGMRCLPCARHMHRKRYEARLKEAGKKRTNVTSYTTPKKKSTRKSS